PQADELGAVGNRGYTVVAELDAIQAQGMYFRELGIYYRNQNNWQKAIEAFEQSLKLNPFDAFVHNRIAVAYEHVGNNKQAAIHYKLASQMNPKSAAAGNVKNIDAKVQTEEFNKKMTAAERLFNKNKFKDAKKAFEEALETGKGILSEEEKQLVQDNIKACEQNMR
ncbi:MAG: tetratricopeptide repeat protein, partial [Candidatus Micrarchaeota archaeon]